MFRYIFRAVCLVMIPVFVLMLALGVAVLQFGTESSVSLGEMALYYLLPGTGIFCLAFLMCGVSAQVASLKIANKLNAIDPVDPPREAVFDEVEPLISRMQEMQAAFGRKKDEFEKTTRYMTEGLILLNDTMKVLTVNDAARRVFRLDGRVEGQDMLFLYPSDPLRLLLRDAREGNSGQSVLQIRNVSYQINASPIFQSGQVSGVVLLIFDITQREQAEKMRREFTANVSHELKTPLQTISGCAELLSGGMVKQEDVPRFSEQIHTEARRMIALVEDIIKLSRLDEGEGNLGMEETDLYEFARKTAQVLGPAANAAGVTLTVQGDSCRMQAIPQLLEAIVYNLCDNAIKYNVNGGSVEVSVGRERGAAVLRVKDTGIGIPIHQQERVFERFYRVDKSHSKQVGGTGLGLSIVKHAARLHRAQIRLRSEVGKGTDVKVTFPLNAAE